MDGLHSRILYSGFALVLQMQLCWTSPADAFPPPSTRLASALHPTLATLPKVKSASLRTTDPKKNKSSDLLPVFYRHSLALQKPLRKIVVADFNGDGLSDIAGLEDRSTKLAVLYGLGNLMFSDARQIDLRSEAIELAAADFNGDRINDLAVLFSKPSKIRFFLGGLGGKSERLTQGGEIEVETGTKKMWLNDAAADGRMELFAVGDAGGVQGFRQLERQKDRVRLRREVKRFSQSAFSNLLLGNFTDSEQGLDFVLTDATAKELFFIRNERIVALAEPVKFTFGAEITAISAADLNQNTVPEVVLSLAGSKIASENEPEAGQLVVLFDVGVGTGIEPLVLAAGPAPAKNLLRDFNLDGFPDIAVLDGEEQTVSIFLGKDDGGFTGRIPLGTGGTALDFAVENIDDDRFPELIFSDAQSNTLCIYTATPPKSNATTSAETMLTDAVRLVAGSKPKSLQLSEGRPEGRMFSLYACAEKSRSLSVFGFESLWMHRRIVSLPMETRWMWLLQKSPAEKITDKSLGNAAKKWGEKPETQLLLVSRTREKMMLVKLTQSAAVPERQAEAKLLVTDLTGASLIEPPQAAPLLMLHDAGDLQVQPQYLFFNLTAEVKTDSKTNFKLEPLLASAMLSPEKSLAVSFPKNLPRSVLKNVQEPPYFLSLWTAGTEPGREVVQPFQVGAAGDAGLALVAAKKIPLRRRTVPHRPPHRLLCADFDGDGKPDYIAASASGATVVMSRRLDTSEEINNFTPLTKTDYFGALDVNGDGLPDMLTGNRRDGTLSVWIKSAEGLGTPSFEPPVKVLGDVDAEDALLVEAGGETVLAVANSRQDTVDLVSLRAFTAKSAKAAQRPRK